MPLKNRWPKSFLITLLVWLVALGVMSFFLLGANVPDTDSFYHARITALMAENGLLHALPWLQETSLATQFTDHHLLYHAVMIPLIWFLEPVQAVTVSHVLLVSLFAVVFYTILKKQAVPYAWAALLVLVGVWPFMVRITLLKATPLALICILLLTFGLLRKWRWPYLVLLMALYTMVHAGFPLAFVVVATVWVGNSIATSATEQRLQLASPSQVVAIVLGALVGIIVSPYFPENVSFFWLQFVQIGLVNYKDTISVGSEWYAYNPYYLVATINVLLIVALYAVIILARKWQQLKRDPFIWGVGLLCVVLCIGTLQSRRYVEYLVPFLVWWSVYIVFPTIQSGAWKADMDSLKQQFGKTVTTVVIGYICVGVSVSYIKTVYNVHNSLRVPPAFEVTVFEGAANAVANHSQPGDIIFHTNWDQFPQLFYHNWQNYYLVGLDATFMYLHSSEQYEQWQRIVDGEYKADSSNQILNSFNARYIFIDEERAQGRLLEAYLIRDSQAEEIYRDNRTRVFYLTP